MDGTTSGVVFDSSQMALQHGAHFLEKAGFSGFGPR